MDGLPTFPGLDVLSQVGRLGRTVRYRLASTREFLVLFDEPADHDAIAAAAEPYLGSVIDRLCPVHAVVRHEGRIGVVIEGELGENPWQQPAWGEAEALPVLRRAASVVAALHARGNAHGALKPDGLRLLHEGEIEVFPAVVLPEPAPETGTPLSALARDLAALADLACHLIAGASLRQPAGVGALPGALMECASPATAQAVRLVLETAGRDPGPADSVDVLRRVGWARDVEPPRRAFPAPVPRSAAAPVTASPTAPAPTNPSASSGASAVGAGAGAGPVDSVESVDAGGRGGRSASRSDAGASRVEERLTRAELRAAPRSSAVPIAVALGLLLVGGALVVIGNPGAMKKFWSGDSADQVAALPTPKDPLAGGGTGSASPAVESPPASSEAPVAEEESATSLADQILEELAAKRAARDAARVTPRKKKNYDRTLIDEGDGLRKAAQEILVTVRDGGLSMSKKNEKLAEAIKKLEAAREKYEGFAEQHPSRERLVEGSIEDVNSLLFFAYRQKTSG